MFMSQAHGVPIAIGHWGPWLLAPLMGSLIPDPDVNTNYIYIYIYTHTHTYVDESTNAHDAGVVKPNQQRPEHGSGNGHC